MRGSKESFYTLERGEPVPGIYRGWNAKAIERAGRICGTVGNGQEKSISPELSDRLKKALALSGDERAALANTLLNRLEATHPPVQEAWDEEVARRMADLIAGKAVTVPCEQRHREILAMVNERVKER